jgi:hypothetical protein
MAAHAASGGGVECAGGANGANPSVSSDPLRRLEAELGEAGGGRSDDGRLYEQAQSLVEEAWSIVTECLVLRDGLLEACHEIEQTMNGIHRRLDALPVAIELDRQEHVANGERAAASGSDGAPINGAIAY